MQVMVRNHGLIVVPAADQVSVLYVTEEVNCDTKAKYFSDKRRIIWK